MEMKQIAILVCLLVVWAGGLASANLKLQSELTKATVRATLWLSKQKSTTVMNHHYNGLVLATLGLVGYDINTGYGCQGNDKARVDKLRKSMKTDVFSSLDFGKMACVLLGAKVLCIDEINVAEKQHINILKAKLRMHALKHCHTMFKYAMGIIAVAAHGEKIPMSIADQMIYQSFNKCRDLDTGAVSAMALKAIASQNDSLGSTRQHALHQFNQLVAAMLTRYGSGNVSSNIIGYSLFAQVLAVTQDKHVYRKVLKNIQKRLVAEQRSDGSFNNHLLTTVHILPALASTNFLDLQHTCNKALEIEETEQQQMDITVTYEVRFPSIQQSLPRSLNVTVPSGSTAFSGLQLASQLENCYDFRYTQSDWGVMIKEVCGRRESPAEKRFWLYSINGKHATVALDFYILKDSDVVTVSYEQL